METFTLEMNAGAPRLTISYFIRKPSSIVCLTRFGPETKS